MENKLLSLDTSTSSTGWALFVNGEYSDCGLIDLKSIKNGHDRMGQMVSSIYNLINYYSPAIITIETPVVVRNPQVQRSLTMIFGTVYGKCIHDNIDFQELRPTEWRKLIDSGKKPRKREELKEWSKQRVKDLFELDVNDDVSDAVLIGQAYINMCNAGGD